MGVASGIFLYVDFERIRKNDGYVYWWELGDYTKPNDAGHLSVKVYNEGDCKLFRFKTLIYSFHYEPMGGGTGDVQESVKKSWKYPPPMSLSETTLEKVCSN